jgi:Ca-activated chloride channel family protein
MDPAAYFDRIALWPLLLLVPVFLGIAFYALGRRGARLDALVSRERRADLCGDSSRARATARILLAGGALLLGFAALLDPVFGKEIAIVENRGVDILVGLDVSRSMLALDGTNSSRLERARREMQALADVARGDRIGSVAFAGEARLAIPLTLDMDAYRGLVEHLDPQTVHRGGTDLGQAIEKAVEAITEASRGEGTGSHEVILLLTDGEDLEGRGLEAARAAAAKGITIHCVGFGEARGSKIVTGDEKGAGAFLRDDQGNEVVSKMDADSLRKIAQATGGEFIRADSMPLPLVELYKKRILPMAKKELDTRERRDRKHRFQWPLLGCVVMLLADIGTSERRRPARPRSAA